MVDEEGVVPDSDRWAGLHGPWSKVLGVCSHMGFAEVWVRLEAVLLLLDQILG